MNKQEAIERIKNIGTLNIYDKVAGQQVDLVIKNEVLDIVSKIDELQKVTIPKFVAEWIEAAKKTHNNLSWVWFSRPSEIKIQKWLDCNTEKFMRAYLDGFEIEQEKLYRVAIAGICYYKLFKNTRTNEYRFYCEKEVEGFTDKLTEQEIKKAGERFWQLAKEVE